MPSQVQIKLENVSKVFVTKVVLHNLNLEIKEGEIFGIIGMSGSGKSTLLNTLVGYYLPEEGDISYRHESGHFRSIFKYSNFIKNYVGVAPQQPSFYPKLTTFENLDHYGALYGLPRSIRTANIEYLLKLTDLEESKDRLGQNLSGGMQKRLGIACALIHKPRVLILDEPTADLDPVLRRQTWHLIKKINEQGTTVIMASHFLTELETLCSTIGILFNGKIVEVGTTDQLKDHYSDDEEIILETVPGRYDAILKQLKKENLPIKNTVNRGHSIMIYTPKAELVLHRTLHVLEDMNEKLLDVHVNKPTLSEVFESLTSKGKIEQ